MTILPKKKAGQKEEGGDAAAAIHHPHHHLPHQHQIGTHAPQLENPHALYVPPGPSSAWGAGSSREDGKRTAFDEPDGPSHSKRRHKASPHRSLRSGKHHRVGSNAGVVVSGPASAPGSPPLPPGPSVQQSSPEPLPPTIEETEGDVVGAHADEDAPGYNSGDEHGLDRGKKEDLTEDEWSERERQFHKLLRKRGLVIRQMREDGACLFRAVADQILGDQEMHGAVRKQCMDYMLKNQDYFSQYVTEDFTSYLFRKSQPVTHGNHVEMQAMSEMYNRPIEVYSYSAEPINTFQCCTANNHCAPLRLSYHRGTHYNSVVDMYRPTVGIGLGLPGIRPGLSSKSQLREAILQHEEKQLEQAMLEDKLKATDWEATNEAIEEQVARESYLQWLRDQEKQAKQQGSSSSSSTVTSSLSPPHQPSTSSLSPKHQPSTSGSFPTSSAVTPTAPSTSASQPEKGKCTPPPCTPTGDPGACGGVDPDPCDSIIPEHDAKKDDAFDALPPDYLLHGYPAWDDTAEAEEDILQQVLAASHQEYLDKLASSSGTYSSDCLPGTSGTQGQIQDAS